MKGMKDGYRNDCKACNLAAKHERYRRNPQQTIDRVKKWQADNPERHAENQERWRVSGGKSRSNRKSHLKRKFGITQEQYEEMLAAQDGGCAICGDSPEVGKALHVDHDHDTGDVRALLCVRCNNGLGQFKEDPILLDRARTYLQTADDEEVAEMVRLTKERVRQLIAAR